MVEIVPCHPITSLHFAPSVLFCYRTLGHFYAIEIKRAKKTVSHWDSEPLKGQVPTGIQQVGAIGTRPQWRHLSL